MSGFWKVAARIILRNRILFLLAIAGATVFLSTQWKNMRFTYTEANLLPNNHPVTVAYQSFLHTFGEEGNLIVLGVKDSALFNLKNFNLWNKLSKQLNAFPEVTAVISIDNLQKLVKNEATESFQTVPFIEHAPKNEEEIEKLKQELFYKLPFYEDFLYNKETQTIRTVVYIDKEIVNTAVRKEFIFNDFNPLIERFEKETGLTVHVSGMPYIRTLNSQTIIDEIGIFVLAALGVTSLLFFFFFRSFRATLISMVVVSTGVMWVLGFLGLLHYEITVLTALIPPLVIVIGVPNCIFLINKYQQEVQKHGNQAKSLQRVISRVGTASLMTNATTAAGFATFIITKNSLLQQFGIVTSMSIIAIFLLSLLIIPTLYSFMPLPKGKHLKHLNKKWVRLFVQQVEKVVKHHRIAVYSISVLLLIAGIIGIYQIKISGSILEDMPKRTEFFNDIKFFQEEFKGILPLEITIDTKRRNGVMSMATLHRMDELENLIRDIPEFSSPISIVSFVKYAKQAFYNGNPNYYQLPTSQESAFIISYAKKSSGRSGLLENFVDSTGQIARITVFMKDIGTDKMERIEETLWAKINKDFPNDRYKVTLTGRALVFMKGTQYLVENLVISLALTIVLISIFMAYTFRSFKMIIISLIPNIFPLVVTAGVMGFAGIPIKPSTILVFSIAFGISVDNAIHFLARYRQELVASGWKIRKSIYAALRETAVSMFYTSVVLFLGFSVFMLSDFGGTKALGGLVSITLLFAMLTNLILLPSLLVSSEKKAVNKKLFGDSNLTMLDDDEN